MIRKTIKKCGIDQVLVEMGKELAESNFSTPEL